MFKIKLHVILFLFMLIPISVLPNVSAETVSQSELVLYLNEFNEQFKNLFETSIDYDPLLNLTYNANIVVSNASGVAIEFFPSNKAIINIKTIDDDVENYLFPNIDLNIEPPENQLSILTWEGLPNQPMFFIGNSSNVIISDLFIITNKGKFTEVYDKGELYLSRTVIDGKYYHFVIIRGNTKSDWNKTYAVKDASTLFDLEKLDSFLKAKEIRSFMAYPTLEELIYQLEWKHQNSREINYDFLEYKRDLEFIRNLAENTYNLDTTFIDELLLYISTIYPKPPEPHWYEKEPWSWIMGTLVGSLLTGIYGKRKFIWLNIVKPMRARFS